MYISYRPIHVAEDENDDTYFTGYYDYKTEAFPGYIVPGGSSNIASTSDDVDNAATWCGAPVGSLAGALSSSNSDPTAYPLIATSEWQLADVGWDPSTNSETAALIRIYYNEWTSITGGIVW